MLSASFELSRFEGRYDGATHFVTICGVSPFPSRARAPFHVYVSDKMGHPVPQWTYLRFLPPFVGWNSEETSTERRKKWERRGKGNAHSTEISLQICFLARYCNIPRGRTTFNVTRVLRRKWHARWTERTAVSERFDWILFERDRAWQGKMRNTIFQAYLP